MLVQQFYGLSEFTKNTDFYCAQIRGNYVCAPKQESVKEVYRELQRTVRTVASAMAATGKLPVPIDIETIIVDGKLGYISATGVSFIGAAFSPAVAPPAEVAWVFEPGITAQQRVERIASRAQEVADYFKHVVANYPEAIVSPPEIVYKEPLRKRLRPVGAIALGSLFIGLLGYAASSAYTYVKK